MAHTTFPLVHIRRGVHTHAPLLRRGLTLRLVTMIERGTHNAVPLDAAPRRRGAGARPTAVQQQPEQQQDVAGNPREAASGVAGDVQRALSGLADQREQRRGTATATQQEGVDRARSDIVALSASCSGTLGS